MNIVIDIQNFRDVEENFIPKEVAILAINATIIEHWIMMPPYPFGDLPERVRRENNLHEIIIESNDSTKTLILNILFYFTL